MNDIIEPTIDYDFSNLYLGPPSTVAGGAYFTKIMYNNNKQLYIQTPKSLTKQGFVKSGKKIYVDLMFDNNDTVFINWIENLEAKCLELIFSKGDNWFQTKLDKDDIESAFTSPFKIYKSGKFYLLRVNVKPNIKIFNDNSNIINLEDITADKTLISIIEIQGIKFSSRNFQIEIELKQSMVVSPDPFLDECFIKKPNKKQSTVADDLEEDIVKNSDNLFATPLTKTGINNNLTKSVSTSDETFSNIEVDIIDIDKKTETNTAFNSKTTVNINPLKNADIQLGDITELDFDLDLNSNDTNDTNDTNDNIVLEIEDLSPEPIKIEDTNILKEVDLSPSLENNLESITLKKPNQVYYEIYKKAREKAKEAKKEAILAFLEAKNIKKTYMLDDIDESDEEDDEDFNFNETEE
jgi:hypothetical protein